MSNANNIGRVSALAVALVTGVGLAATPWAPSGEPDVSVATNGVDRVGNPDAVTAEGRGSVAIVHGTSSTATATGGDHNKAFVKGDSRSRQLAARISQELVEDPPRRRPQPRGVGHHDRPRPGIQTGPGSISTREITTVIRKLLVPARWEITHLALAIAIFTWSASVVFANPASARMFHRRARVSRVSRTVRGCWIAEPREASRFRVERRFDA